MKHLFAKAITGWAKKQPQKDARSYSFDLYKNGSKVATMALHTFPGAGTLAALGINSGLNAFFTYRYLRSVAKVYDKYDDERFFDCRYIVKVCMIDGWWFGVNEDCKLWVELFIMK